MASSKQFRKKAYNLIRGHFDSDGFQVFDSRIINFTENKLPIINLFVSSEKVNQKNRTEIEKTFIFEVNIIVFGSFDSGKSVADKLDDIRYQIESLIISSSAIEQEDSEQVYSISLTGTPVIRFSKESDSMIGEAIINFDVTMEQELISEVPSDFNLLSIEYELQGNNSVREARDDLDFTS